MARSAAGRPADRVDARVGCQSRGARIARRRAGCRARAAGRRDRLATESASAHRLLPARHCLIYSRFERSGRPTFLKLHQVADRLHCRLEGDGDIEIARVAGIEQAQPGDLTFIAHEKYVAKLAATRASAVIVSDAIQGAPGGPALLRAASPYVAFAQAVGLLTAAPPAPRGVDAASAIASDVGLGPDVSIGAFVTIGAGATIGARTIVYPNVTIGPGVRIGADCIVRSQVSIRDGVVIGNRVILQDGAVLGSEGFGFARQPDGTHLKIPQRAAVIIEDDVEIGANTTIDRPAVGETRIGAGTKIDNLVQIAHGVRVGRRVLLAAQVGVAGSCVIEDDVILAGQVGVANHVHLGQGTIATAQTGIPNSVDAGSYVSGYPAIPHRDWLKSSAIFRALPALRKRMTELEQHIAELEEKLHACQTASEK
ncbi:MAG: UDP-3-O-(3-hydroxymyristoyl)glucosamine N-acyltransferase [Luteitalea sp.]|nr:UDP-3-O-(3-hydroxymyristoyl)glucosamine N-acyltransferase [Luteitalea sp.]